jgi:hypothetical protein
MILLFDLTNSDTAHVPVNSGLGQAISAAFPLQQVRIHAEAGHIEALRQNPGLGACTNVSFTAIAFSPLQRWKTQLVSARRFWHELRVMRQALRAAPVEPHLIVLASATPTAICAALFLARLAPSPVAVQVGLHGNLNEVAGWRPRNPLRRRYDLRSMLSRPRSNLRLLVFEPCIRDALGRLLPTTSGRTDVLRHPVNLAEAAQQQPVPLAFPVRIAFAGMATEAKGIRSFLEVARNCKALYGDRVEFHIVGGRPANIPPEKFRDIAHEVETGHISRAAFTERLERMHFVMLPLRADYYNLSPSGGLMDAIGWAKPLIATRIPIVKNLFAEGGDIGYLCEGNHGLQAAVEAIVNDMDAGRHARQTEALRRLRVQRAPTALALAYRDMVRRGFPGLLDAAPRRAALLNLPSTAPAPRGR